MAQRGRSRSRSPPAAVRQLSSSSGQLQERPFPEQGQGHCACDRAATAWCRRCGAWLCFVRCHHCGCQEAQELWRNDAAFKNQMNPWLAYQQPEEVRNNWTQEIPIGEVIWDLAETNGRLEQVRSFLGTVGTQRTAFGGCSGQRQDLTVTLHNLRWLTQRVEELWRETQDEPRSQVRGPTGTA